MSYANQLDQLERLLELNATTTSRHVSSQRTANDVTGYTWFKIGGNYTPVAELLVSDQNIRDTQSRIEFADDTTALSHRVVSLNF
jgi:hypothetical protein